MLDIGIIQPRFGRLYDWSVGSACAACASGPGGRQHANLCMGFERRRRCVGLQAVEARAACPADRARRLAGRFAAFAGKREPAVGRLLDQPVDKQRVQRAITLCRVGQPGDVEFGTGYRRVVATQTSSSRPRTCRSVPA